MHPDALDLATSLDDELRHSTVRSKIHGIPFLVKDNIATKDKMQTTAGCAAILGTAVPDDAQIVKSLRAAGGPLLGKANMSEWASMRASYYAEGYSSRGGQHRHPYNLAEHAGGSSSGSASGLAANMCAFSIGTETDGSIMFPADRNAVIGIKPTVRLIPMKGVIPEAPSFDTVGIFGRSTEDVAIVLDVIAARDEGHVRSGSQSSTRELPRSYAVSLAKKDALRGARFGLPMKLVKEITSAGARSFNVDFPSAEEIVPPNGWDWGYGTGRYQSELSEATVVRVEFCRSLQDYLSTLMNNSSEIRWLEDVIAYIINHTDTEGGVSGTHPAWPTGQDNFDKCTEMKKFDEATYSKALEYVQRNSREGGIDAALKHADGDLDALLVPLQAEGGVACSVAAKAGYPMVTVPVGVSEKGVPFGLGVMQTALGEDLLIR